MTSGVRESHYSIGDWMTEEQLLAVIGRLYIALTLRDSEIRRLTEALIESTQETTVDDVVDGEFQETT
jgi:hypothetical protein